MAHPRGDYAPFDWENLGEPLTPFIALKFRANENELHTFPNSSNRIYVRDAQFFVLDDNGYSTARIVLSDPDFVNLERIFVKALFLANSMSKSETNWFCAAFWGWSYYGRDVGAQRKTSGMHYYMLKSLSYDLDEVELRVTVELADIGSSLLDQTDDAKETVGVLTPGAYITTERESSNENGYEDDGPWAPLAEQAEAEDGGLREAGGAAALGISTNNRSASEERLGIRNIINGLTPWEVIVRLCSSHNPKIEAVALDDVPEFSETLKNYVIPANAPFKEEIDKLLINTKEFREEEPVGRHWGILAGGGKSGNTLKLPFGWVPDPPPEKDTLKFQDKYRKARTLVFKPANKEQIARGETMVTSLNYQWTSQGYWRLGLPKVYAITEDSTGQLDIYYTKDDWENRASSSNLKWGGRPDTQRVSLSDAIDEMKGYEIQFNFDSRTMTNEEISQRGKTILINVWNFFAQELTNVNFEIAGDPWLDNTLFTSDGKDGRGQDLLVDLYNSYFDVKVYRPGVNTQNEMSAILTGKYLCLKGCAHSISEGTYTTSLTLIKTF